MGTARACGRRAPAAMRAPRPCDGDPSTTRSRRSRTQSRRPAHLTDPITDIAPEIRSRWSRSARRSLRNSGCAASLNPNSAPMSAQRCSLRISVGAALLSEFRSDVARATLAPNFGGAVLEPARWVGGRAYAGLMQLTPERLVAGGDALARDADGRVVFVEGGLPGETVEVEVDTAKKDFARARIVEIVEKSPIRDSPSCARSTCGVRRMRLDALPAGRGTRRQGRDRPRVAASDRSPRCRTRRAHRRPRWLGEPLRVSHDDPSRRRTRWHDRLPRTGERCGRSA